MLCEEKRYDTRSSLDPAEKSRVWGLGKFNIIYLIKMKMGFDMQVQTESLCTYVPR